MIEILDRRPTCYLASLCSYGVVAALSLQVTKLHIVCNSWQKDISLLCVVTDLH